MSSPTFPEPITFPLDKFEVRPGQVLVSPDGKFEVKVDAPADLFELYRSAAQIGYSASVSRSGDALLALQTSYGSHEQNWHDWNHEGKERRIDISLSSLEAPAGDVEPGAAYLVSYIAEYSDHKYPIEPGNVHTFKTDCALGIGAFWLRALEDQHSVWGAAFETTPWGPVDGGQVVGVHRGEFWYRGDLQGRTDVIAFQVAGGAEGPTTYKLWGNVGLVVVY
jgi:hypothetical protein